MIRYRSKLFSVLNRAIFCGLLAFPMWAVAQSSGHWNFVNPNVDPHDEPAAWDAINAANLWQPYVSCLDLVVPWGGSGHCDNDTYTVDGVVYEGIFIPQSSDLCNVGSIVYQAWVYYYKEESKYYWYVDDGEVTTGFSVQKYVCE